MLIPIIPTVDQVIAHPEICLSGGMTIALVAFLCGTVIPGCVAWSNKVFYREDMIERCKHKPELEKLDKQLAARKQCQERIDQVNEELALLSIGRDDAAKMRSLISLRQLLEKDLEKAKKEVLADAFVTSDLAYVFTVVYTALAILVCLAPVRSGANNVPTCWSPVIAAVGVVALLFVVPLWSRAVLPPKEERKVYSFVNWDISRWSFATIYGNNLLLAVMLGIVWHRWIHAFSIIRACNNLMVREGDNILVSYIPVSYAFADWQVSSIVLALGFFVFTWLYWKRVSLQEDQRYLIQAVIVHVLWGVTWCVISLPALLIWWNHHGAISPWNAILSLAAAATSYVLPWMKKADS